MTDAVDVFRAERAGRHSLLVEVAVGSVTEAIAAERAGADRLELCMALEVGGLTPSAATITACLAAVQIPVVVMIRPRAGGFLYDRHEFEVMLADADAAVAAGAAGIVFGILDARGRVDSARVESVIARAAGRETVFHRAFDFVRDSQEALERLIDSGCRRLLTSGGAATALQGRERIAALVHQAAGRIEILPGGGIRDTNVATILAATGCTQIHVGASTARQDVSLRAGPALNLWDERCVEDNRHRVIDEEAIRRILQAVFSDTP